MFNEIDKDRSGKVSTSEMYAMLNLTLENFKPKPELD